MGPREFGDGVRGRPEPCDYFQYGQERLQMPNKKGHWLAFIGTVVFTTCYIVAIMYCGNEGQFLDGTNANLWQQVTRGRVFAVILFALVTLE
jgi:uncharacterized membrane protein (DUF485 family)